MSDLFGNLERGVKGVGAGEDSTEGHDGEGDDGKVDRVAGEEKDNVALADPDAVVGGDGGHDRPIRRRAFSFLICT